ncbi:MAG: CRISPR-associated helicase Cas3' [Candidatus Omnitrophica bacterium]|nr:CRISPR-associated helicase Cas3' [Candidatus Omnitrophota bacterium]
MADAFLLHQQSPQLRTPQKTYYAHSREGKPVKEWHLLKDHLENTARKASDFSKDFNAAEWAYLAGLWHDLGKYSEEFQNRLSEANGNDAHIEKPGRVDHSTAGAQYAAKMLGDKGRIIAYTIAGHHAGLPNGEDNKDSCLSSRLKKWIPDYSCGISELPLALNSPGLPFACGGSISNQQFAFRLSVFIRMIFSALVDADFLDTEEFAGAEKCSWRKGYPGLLTLNQRLETYLERFSGHSNGHPVTRIRMEVLGHCREAYDWPSGLFSLTVPTGGGKTLSSLSFAMRHALKYGKKRIIYVIPYTSIIEQNAAVFREALGDDAVLEHHSNFEPEEEDHRSRLASENWDAPIVVTTNVQFFESLFACRTSQCRKLHNIANSVVILDEAQMLPTELLKPCLEILKELSNVYKTSIVLCTATQPALSTTETFKNGLDGVREIIPNPGELYDTMKRVEIKNLSTITDDDLVKKVVSCDQVLCIVNTRRHARVVFEKMRALVNGQGCFHLSALMCPLHRTRKLGEIKKALREGKLCRVISTQLVEAGVDIDFPVVYRSIAGVDSIAQAAGRCNREGRLDKGEVFVFMPQEGLPRGHFRQAAQTAESISRRHQDILSLKAVEEYFRELYWIKGEKDLDAYGILPALTEDAARGNLPFREVAEKFKIIKDGMVSVIIPWKEEADVLIQELNFVKYPAKFARQLQKFTVQVYPQAFAILRPALECIRDQYYVLRNMDIYRDDIGLCPEDPAFHKIESLIC